MGGARLGVGVRSVKYKLYMNAFIEVASMQSGEHSHHKLLYIFQWFPRSTFRCASIYTEQIKAMDFLPSILYRTSQYISFAYSPQKLLITPEFHYLPGYP